MMTDATLIAADASLDSMVHKDPEQAKHETEARQRCGTLLAVRHGSCPTRRIAVAPIPTPRWLRRRERHGSSSTKCIRRSTPTVESSWIPR